MVNDGHCDPIFLGNQARHCGPCQEIERRLLLIGKLASDQVTDALSLSDSQPSATSKFVTSPR
jgi:hypothetical protein